MALRKLLSFVLLVALFNLGYSATLRTDASPEDDTPDDEIRTNITELVGNDGELQTELFNRAMEVLQKQEEFYEMQQQKVQLEIELLKKAINENDTIDENQSEENATVVAVAPIESTEEISVTQAPVVPMESTEEVTATQAPLEVPTTVVLIEEDENETLTTGVADSTMEPVAVTLQETVLMQNPDTNTTATAIVEEEITRATEEPTTEDTTTVQAETETATAEDTTTIIIETTTTEEETTTTTEATTTETTTDETTVGVTKLVIDEKGSTSYEFYKASSGPIRSSLEAVAVSLIATIFVLRF